MDNFRQYHFPKEIRKLLESFPHPLAAYQFINDKIVTLLVSDGMCHITALTRPQLIHLFNTDMYRGTHPDDVARVAELAHRFIITENEYDVTYRTILYGKMEYRSLHAISKFQTMEDGSRVAFTVYDDVTDLIKKESINVELVDAPKAKFLDENMSAMAVVERTSNKLLYYNNALLKMLPPKVHYDSGRTFQDFFYHDLIDSDGVPLGIAGLYDSIDLGSIVVTEPITGRALEVTTVSSTWDHVPTYTLFFFEHASSRSSNSGNQEVQQRRTVFYSIMNDSSANNLQYYEYGYKAYWVWNLTKNGILVKDSGHEHIHKHLGETFTYTQYWNFTANLFDGVGDQEFAETVTLDGLKEMYLKGIHPQTRDFTVHNNNGQVTLRTGFILMQSPDDGDLYMKVTEENITDSVMQKNILYALVQKQFDFIIYMDIPGDRCRVINANTTNSAQEDLNGSLTELYRSVSERIGAGETDLAGLISYIEEKCKDSDYVAFTYKISENSYKKISITVLNRSTQQYSIFCSDVTEILKRENKIQNDLRLALENAEEANSAKSEFVSRISHDIRTPISIISSMTDFALEDMHDLEKLSNDLQKIKTANGFLLSLINDVLDISKLDSGKITLREETYSYSDFVDKLKTMFIPLCEDKNIHFDIIEKNNISGAMFIDSTRLNQVALNLLSNAVKYTPCGGKISFISYTEVDTQDPARLNICFRVIDSGIGMSEDFVTRMFDPFSQEYENPLRPKDSVGTGLGLSIVKKIIDLMSGTIDVKSEIGKGTTITCALPCRYLSKLEDTDNTINNATPETSTIPHLTGHILIAEDNQINMEIIQRIIQNYGLTFTSAQDGKEALQKFLSAPDGTYDAILMDIQMPIMDGIQATKEIRSSKKTDAKIIPIIALTANAFEESIKTAKEYGMNYYLTKPIEPSKVFKLLETILSKK